MKQIILLLIIAVLAGSCHRGKTKFESENEMAAYVNDPGNGFIQSFESRDFLFEAKLSPAVAEDTIPQLGIHMRISRKDGQSVLESGSVNKQEILTREGYLAFEVTGDVYFENGEKIIPAVFSHYERNYGLKPSVDLLFSFSAFQADKDVYFNYRDQLFGQGLIRIKFNKELFTKYHVLH